MARPLPSPDQLAELDLDALKALWSKTFTCTPPPGAKRELLVRLLAYALQERVHGGLSRAVRKSLQAMARVDQKSATADKSAATLRLGARLIRRWNGTTHEVTVLDRGFAYRGKQYRSLTEIAQAITGAHWSGPRFFGLKKTRSKSEVEARA